MPRPVLRTVLTHPIPRLDEIHAHKTADLLNVLTSAAGARANPLWLYTTTEGYTNPGPWAEIRQFAKRLLSGVFGHTADHFLVIFFAVDDEDKTLGIKADDEFDESCWIKANPLIEVNPHLLTAIRKEAVEAKQMPSKLAEFRIKRLNRQASTAEGWINLTKWQECSGAVDLDVPGEVSMLGRPRPGKHNRYGRIQADLECGWNYLYPRLAMGA